MAEAERLVVVVLSFEKRELTLECLASIRRLRFRPLDVVVVDNASSDGSADAVAAAYPEVLLVRSPVNTGAAGGRNLGLRVARERFDFGWLLFVDDDARLDDRLADELIGALRADPQAGMATPKAYRTLAPELIAAAGGMRVRLGRGSVVDIGAGEPDRGQYDQGGAVESCVGYAVLLRREALDQVEGFDESYNPYGWEEVDFSLRLRALGWTIRYVPTAICWHAGGAVGRGGRRVEYERGKAANYLRLMRRHATALEWVAFAAVAPFRLARLARMRLGDRSWRVLRAHALGVLDVFRRG